MQTFKYNGENQLFNDKLCTSNDIFFHGTHIDNAPAIESEGIRRPDYPDPILEILEEYKRISQKLGLSTAFEGYNDTYKGKKDIVFLSRICTSAADYVKSVGGEKMHTVQISYNNLKLLFDDKSHFQKKLRQAELRYQQAPNEEEKNKFLQSLQLYKNIEHYKELLDKTESVFKRFPQFFESKGSEGIVYAIFPDKLELDDQGDNGLTAPSIPVMNIIAKATFELG
ncbi:MAG: hypothetical protein GVY20_14395, partial [Bacteroidetes bacterium]|nr:hypothetical protein [Bacteroidota bacterium]